MIKIEKGRTYGWEFALEGMRNAHESWDKSDSGWFNGYKKGVIEVEEYGDIFFGVGENDLTLATQLARAGSDHGKFLRFINVGATITAPIYWWKEYDTYKVGTVANSTSTMHRVHCKEFNMEDFSIEHLNSKSKRTMETVINALNTNREIYLETKDKKDWWQLIQLLPSTYNQKRTVQLNYEVLRNMYFARRNHKLDEWHVFCDWVEILPLFKEIFLE